MKKELFFILLFLDLAINAQVFMKEKFTESFDLIQITSLKQRVLGMKNIQVFTTTRDTIIYKYAEKEFVMNRFIMNIIMINIGRKEVILNFMFMISNLTEI